VTWAAIDDPLLEFQGIAGHNLPIAPGTGIGRNQRRVAMSVVIHHGADHPYQPAID
jgi:hypothetical protein